jgi:hypothetical protein
MSNSSFSTKPNVLSEVVRNVVVGRALAGSYDAHETVRQATAACHAAARQKLGKQRLSSAEAAEVDALVLATRAQAFEHMNPALRGSMPEGVLGQLQAQAQVQPSATQSENETSKAILAALGRLEKLITMLLTLVFHKALGGSKTSSEPLLAEFNGADDRGPKDGRAALPAWDGRVIEVAQETPANRNLPALPAASSPSENKMVIYNKDAS